MTKFLVLYRSSVTAAQMGNAHPEQMQAGMEMWQRWGEEAAGHIVDFGAPLAEPRFVPANASRAGTYVDGFSILEGDSEEVILKLLDDHPHLHSPDPSIEVLELLPVPGM